MKINPSALSERHIGMLCVIRFCVQSTDFVGHSQKHGLEESTVSDQRILVGKITEITKDEILFSDCYYSTHPMNLAYSLGPRYSKKTEMTISKESIHPKRKIVLNHLPTSNAVMQHLLKSNKNEFWNREKRLAEMLKEGN